MRFRWFAGLLRLPALRVPRFASPLCRAFAACYGITGHTYRLPPRFFCCLLPGRAGFHYTAPAGCWTCSASGIIRAAFSLRLDYSALLAISCTYLLPPGALLHHRAFTGYRFTVLGPACQGLFWCTASLLGACLLPCCRFQVLISAPRSRGCTAPAVVCRACATAPFAAMLQDTATLDDFVTAAVYSIVLLPACTAAHYLPAPAWDTGATEPSPALPPRRLIFDYAPRIHCLLACRLHGYCRLHYAYLPILLVLFLPASAVSALLLPPLCCGPGPHCFCGYKILRGAGFSSCCLSAVPCRVAILLPTYRRCADCLCRLPLTPLTTCWIRSGTPPATTLAPSAFWVRAACRVSYALELTPLPASSLPATIYWGLRFVLARRI